MSAGRIAGMEKMVAGCGQILSRMRRRAGAKLFSHSFKKNRDSSLLKVPITVR